MSGSIECAISLFDNLLVPKKAATSVMRGCRGRNSDWRCSDFFCLWAVVEGGLGQVLNLARLGLAMHWSCWVIPSVIATRVGSAVEVVRVGSARISLLDQGRSVPDFHLV